MANNAPFSRMSCRVWARAGSMQLGFEGSINVPSKSKQSRSSGFTVAFGIGNDAGNPSGELEIDTYFRHWTRGRSVAIVNPMKSAYELAMERLEKESPQVSLSEEKKQEIADIDRKCRAKIAERKLFLQGKLEEANAEGDLSAVAQIEDELAREIRSLEARCEEQKEAARDVGSN